MNSPITVLRSVGRNSSHPIWMVMQQLGVRGLVAAKFLLSARLLGPAEMGLVGVALIAVAVIEGLSETGLAQAVVQRKTVINHREAGAIWTLQAFRGICIGLVLIALAYPISYLLKISGAATLIAWAALVPVIKNSVNPGFFLIQRNRRFKVSFAYETSGAVVDFSVTLLLINSGHGAISLIVGTICGEFVKNALSWTWLRIPIFLSFQWGRITKLTSFGYWIWRSSVIVVLLNQADKFIVARLVGVTEFGLYQVANRVAQLAIADGVFALGQFLYPNIAFRYRNSASDANEYVKKILFRIAPIVFCIAIFFLVFSEKIIRFTLGVVWIDAANILRVLIVSMIFGATNAVLSAYHRATGNPRFVAKAVTWQFGVLLALAPALTWQFGAIGMAYGSAISTAIATLCLILLIKER